MIDAGRDRRWYEQRKRDSVIAALRRTRYASVFEPACGHGALTRALGERAERILAVDADDASIAAAERDYASAAIATFRRARLPRDWPDATFDLIVLSEWLYYVDTDDRAAIAARASASLRDAGDLIAVHWRQPIAECAERVESIHDALGRALGLRVAVAVDDEDFLLHLWTRDAISVAAHEGLR